MRDHWSCSRFAHWLAVKLGGDVKPNSGTMEEWDEWEEKAKKHKLAYWVTEVALDKVQDIVNSPSDLLNNIRYYYKNRWSDKLHYLQTRLPKGKYHELDTRLLHGMFESLVDFIEIEKAWISVMFDTEARTKYLGVYRTWWKRWSSFRSPEAGIAHLLWETTIEEDSPSQAKAAREQLALYNWWKARPNRPEPWDASGLNAVFKLYNEKYDQNWLLSRKSKITPAERLIYDEASRRLEQIEQAYNDEDEAMMIRLIMIRKYLWT